MVEKIFKGSIPQCLTTQEITQKHINKALCLADKVKEAIEHLSPQKAVHFIVCFLNDTNSYLEELHPWTVLKEKPVQKDKQEIAGEALYTCLESLRISGILLSPIMPLKMKELLQSLGWRHSPRFEDAKKWGLLEKGLSVQKAHPLFPRIDV